jgi:hypothetical protein
MLADNLSCVSETCLCVVHSICQHSLINTMWSTGKECEASAAVQAPHLPASHTAINLWIRFYKSYT